MAAVSTGDEYRRGSRYLQGVADSKVEGDLLALVLVVGKKAGLLIRDELVGESRRRDLRGEQGNQPVCEDCQLHRWAVVVYDVSRKTGGVREASNSPKGAFALDSFRDCHAGALRRAAGVWASGRLPRGPALQGR